MLGDIDLYRVGMSLRILYKAMFIRASERVAVRVVWSGIYVLCAHKC